MNVLRIFKNDKLPSTLRAHQVYLIAPEDSEYFEMYITDANGNARKSINNSDVMGLVNNKIQELPKEENEPKPAISNINQLEIKNIISGQDEVTILYKNGLFTTAPISVLSGVPGTSGSTGLDSATLNKVQDLENRLVLLEQENRAKTTENSAIKDKLESIQEVLNQTIEFRSANGVQFKVVGNKEENNGN